MHHSKRFEQLLRRMVLDPIHGWRLPDRRWRLGRLRAEVANEIPESWMDEWVYRAYGIHMALRAGGALIESACLDRVCPDTADAFRFFLDRDSFRRSELEARLLAGEPSDAIADKCSIRSGVVEAYHEIFFCVRPYLETPQVVMGDIIGAKVYHGHTENDGDDIMLKILGYLRGPNFLDTIVDFYRSPQAAVSGGLSASRARLEKPRAGQAGLLNDLSLMRK